MGVYGPGLTSGQVFMMEKDKIRRALNHQTIVDETEDGYIYGNCTKEESDQVVLSAYDYAVYQCEEAYAASRAQERIIKELLEKAGMEYTEYFQKFITYKEEESQKYQDYRYEGDQEFEDSERKNTFRVIQGTKE